MNKRTVVDDIQPSLKPRHILSTVRISRASLLPTVYSSRLLHHAIFQAKKNKTMLELLVPNLLIRMRSTFDIQQNLSIDEHTRCQGKVWITCFPLIGMASC